MSEVVDKIDVLNADWLASRRHGDTFEIGGLFQGVTKEPIVYTLENIQVFNKSSQYTFVASYLGIKLGEYRITVKKTGELKIEQVELK